MAEQKQKQILVFPLPLQGPLNGMLKLAHLLCLADIHISITFLLTDHIYTRLHMMSSHTFLTSNPGFHIRSIPDGLPQNHPRDNILELFSSLKKSSEPLIREMLIDDGIFSCVIADGMLGFICDIASNVGIPFFSVRTMSPACAWVFYCLPKLIEAGELPFQGHDLDVAIKSIPGMATYLRRRDLPKFCRTSDLNDPTIQMYMRDGAENPRAYGVILNTFEELDSTILSEMRCVCPNIYTIGPLHAHLKAKLAAKQTLQRTLSTSLWPEDWTCMRWLDAQPVKSVIYVSFGSLALMTDDQLMEFWHGLVRSSQRFLWVIRSNLIREEWERRRLPVELLEGTKERGYIVGWAPQEEVLAHPSIGGFLTHCGWNSMLESIYEGVPMICWPYFLDQLVNSRLVEEWKLGVDMKDTCERSLIEKAVRDLMEVRKEEFLAPTEQVRSLAKVCLSEGGSSYANLERLINDIKS